MKRQDKKYYRKLLTEKYPIKKEDRFLELIDDLIIKIDAEKYPNSIFFFKGDFKEDSILFEHDLNSKQDIFWCSYDKIWSVFEREYSMNAYEIQTFIKYVLKVKVPTSLVIWKPCAFLDEELFKLYKKL